ncbi:MAG: hypothetical protein ACOCP8_10285, partial [archaeon]
MHDEVIKINSFKLSNYKVNSNKKGFDIEKIKNGDVVEKKKMIESLLPFIIKESKIEGKINDDLLQELIVETLDKAVKKYDKDRGVKFITFLKYLLYHSKLNFLKEHHNQFN